MRFHGWSSWAEREFLPECQRPGVYLLACFQEGPPTSVDTMSREIIYVGETVDQTLAKRWYDFARSAFQGKSGHSGGWTFSEKFLENRVSEPPSWLFLAAMPVLFEKPRRSAFIRYVERRIIWEYVDHFGEYPSCNTK